MTTWDALFIAGGSIEALFALLVMINPDILFPGVNSAGNLSSKWFSAGIGALGALAFRVVRLPDADPRKVDASLCLMFYNVTIGVMTALRVSRGMQTDGPTGAKVGTCNAKAGAVIGLLIHFTLAGFCIAQWVTFGDNADFVWGIALVALSALLPVFTLCSDMPPESAALAAASPPPPLPPSIVERHPVPLANIPISPVRFEFVPNALYTQAQAPPPAQAPQSSETVRVSIPIQYSSS